MTAFEVRNLLERAAVFARGGDFTAAVTHAKAALHVARDEDSRAEARLTLQRFEAEERAWRSAIEARAAGVRRM
jgi:hypothetical protein